MDHLHSMNLMGLQVLIGVAAVPDSQGLVLPPRPCPCGSCSALKQPQPEVYPTINAPGLMHQLFDAQAHGLIACNFPSRQNI